MKKLAVIALLAICLTGCATLKRIAGSATEGIKSAAAVTTVASAAAGPVVGGIVGLMVFVGAAAATWKKGV